MSEELKKEELPGIDCESFGVMHTSPTWNFLAVYAVDDGGHFCDIPFRPEQLEALSTESAGHLIRAVEIAWSCGFNRGKTAGADGLRHQIRSILGAAAEPEVT